jgi:predicted nucleic acid-binding protein
MREVRVFIDTNVLLYVHQFSWWDCLLLASAIELGCTHFLSEDLKDGQTIEGLTILSPFAHTPDQILVSR